MNRRIVACALAAALLAGCNGLGARIELPAVESGRGFLVSGEPETSGYGLYSYLLLGSPPDTAAGRQRYLMTIAAYLNFISRIEDMKAAQVPDAELNIIYLFVTDMPPPQVTSIRAGGLPLDGDLAPAKWVLDHYDYARARAILHTLPRAHPDGPYILSARVPLTGKQSAPPDYLEQDLSHAPADFAASWVKTFLAQFSAPTDWQAGRLRPAALAFIQTLTTLSTEYPQVQRALEKWITVAG